MNMDDTDAADLVMQLKAKRAERHEASRERHKASRERKAAQAKKATRCLAKCLVHTYIRI